MRTYVTCDAPGLPSVGLFELRAEVVVASEHLTAVTVGTAQRSGVHGMAPKQVAVQGTGVSAVRPWNVDFPIAQSVRTGVKPLTT